MRGQRQGDLTRRSRERAADFLGLSAAPPTQLEDSFLDFLDNLGMSLKFYFQNSGFLILPFIWCDRFVQR